MSNERSWISRMLRPPGSRHERSCRNGRGPGPPAVTVWMDRCRAGMCPRGDERGSVNRRQEATCGAIEDESPVLPGRALTETRQPLHVAPDRTWIRFELL